MGYGPFHIFAEAELRPYLEQRLAAMKQDIEAQQPDYILNVDQEQYLDYLATTFSVEPLAIDVDSATVSVREERVPAEIFPVGGFDVRHGEHYVKPVIRYHIPVSGNQELLRLAPSSRLVWSREVSIEDDAVCFDIVDFYANADRIKSEANPILNNIRQQAQHVTTEIEQFNTGLRAAAAQLLSGRKERLRRQSNVLESLGVPIRKAATVPETFVLPKVRRKVLAKPSADARRDATPRLDPEVYQEILKTIYEMGKAFERYPSTYADKDEEALRDHLILQLEPRFEGSTTGETFNKTGKTDLLIRYEKNNIFVGECKFWRGQAQHGKTIDQILSYLTWRDSKTAIIYFVDGKQISTVLAEIAVQTPKHPCFVRGLKKTDDSWQGFEFHLPGDPGCKIELTVLVFHIPKASR